MNPIIESQIKEEEKNHQIIVPWFLRRKHLIFSSLFLALRKRWGFSAVPSWCAVFPQAQCQVSSLHSDQQLAELQASSLCKSAALCVLHSCRNPSSLPADCLHGLPLLAAQRPSRGSSSLDTGAAVVCKSVARWSRLHLWYVHNQKGLETASLDTLRERHRTIMLQIKCDFKCVLL